MPAALKPINIHLPLQFSPAGAFLTNDTTLDAVRNNISVLLKTNWGERPMNYEYGANLRALLFESQSDIEQLISDRIMHSVERWLPGVAVTDIQVDTDPARVGYNTAEVKVDFNIAGTDLSGQVSATIK